MYQITFPPQSNRASWIFIGMVTDLDDNPIDLSLCSLVFQVSAASQGGPNVYGDSVQSYYGHTDYSGDGVS